MTRDQAPVVVVGAGLAGMSAAARLAKLGRTVTLVEAGVTPGDAGLPVLEFPAPWRDLFRKSGRPLEAELARRGYALVPAAPPTYRFADGSALVLPTDRGEQLTVVTAAYGSPAAVRWRDLLDRLDEVWQTLRPLGYETEAPAGRLPLRTRRALLARRTIADLAAGLDEPHLEAVVRSVAHRNGSTPEQTAAMVAVDLAVQRTFGRWEVRALPDHVGVDRGGAPLLTELLAARLELRGVHVERDSAVEAVTTANGQVSGLRTATGHLAAGIVILTGDPWTVVDELVPLDMLARTRRSLATLQPAAAPTVSHHLVDPVTAVSETVELTEDGTPTITYTRPGADRGIASVHDYGSARRDPAYGVAWSGFRSWLRRPPVTTETPGVILAGPASPAGPSPSAQVLSGALAAYAADPRAIPR